MVLMGEPRGGQVGQDREGAGHRAGIGWEGGAGKAAL